MNSVLTSFEEDMRSIGLDKLLENRDPDLDEGLKIGRKAKFKKRRPQKRLGAAMKARQKIASRKRRRTAGGKRLAKLRGKAMKAAKKRGLKAGRISIQVASQNRVANLIEDLGRISRVLRLSEHSNELRTGFEKASEVAEITRLRLEGLRDDVASSSREEIDGLIEDLAELEGLAEVGLRLAMEGEAAFESDDGNVSLEDALSELVDELSDYVEAVEEFEQET